MKTIIKSLCLVMALSSICYAEMKSSCSEKDMKAIKANFDETYKNYAFFFDTLNCYERKAVAGSEKAISSIIGLYGIGFYNAEYTEWFDEALVKIFIKHPKKLLNLLLNEKNKEVIDGVLQRIKHPITEDDEAISSIVKKLSKDPKYKCLTDPLLERYSKF